MTSYQDIEPEEVAWLWPGKIPLGEVTVLAGFGGCGKSMLTASLVSRLTNGLPMPGCSTATCPAGSAALISVEDDSAKSTVWRLAAAEADLSRVHAVGTDHWELPDDVPALRAELDEITDLRLLVVDPLGGVASRSLASNISCRRMLRPLSVLAKDYGIAVVVIAHLTKAGSVGGSQGLQDAVRSLLRVEKEASDPRIRTLTVAKSNMASDAQPAISYRLTGTGTDTAVSWIEQVQAAPVGPTQGRILAAVRNAAEPLTGPEIARLTNTSNGVVRVLLRTMTKRGVLVQPARGLYAAAVA